jgi:hypothetical protein
MQMKKLIAVIILTQSILTGIFAQPDPTKESGSAPAKKKLIYAADFGKALDTTEWLTEIDPAPDDAVFSKNGKLTMDTKSGVTVWLNKLLEGNIQIEYKRTVLVNGNTNDRLSDLNQFWMATDPRNSMLFKRNGVFSQYDSLQLYYVSIGGNSNTTTRFRKYDGNGNRILLQEYKDAAHLLKEDKKYTIKIILEDNVTSFWEGDECYFIYSDPAPLRKGYFGFRSIHSRQEIEDFKIYQLY